MAFSDNEAQFFTALETQLQSSKFTDVTDVWLPAFRDGQEVLLNRTAGEEFRQELLEDYALLRHDVFEGDYTGAYAEDMIMGGITESLVERLSLLPEAKLPFAVKGSGYIRAPQEGNPMHHMKLAPENILFGDITGVEYGYYCSEDAIRYAEFPPTRGVMLYLSNVAICFDVESYEGSQGVVARPDIDAAMLPIGAHDLEVFQVFPKV